MHLPRFPERERCWRRCNAEAEGTGAWQWCWQLLSLFSLPTGLPRAVSGVHLALKDLEVVGSSRGRRLGASLPRPDRHWGWETWKRAGSYTPGYSQSLPTEARLLTPRPHTELRQPRALRSPISHRDHQMFLIGYPRPRGSTEDALRFLHRDDLADLGVTHLHVTDQLEADFAPSARRLLGDPRHFRLLAEVPTSSGERHRVFEVQSGAGTTEVDPSSYRALRQLVPQSATRLPRWDRCRMLSAPDRHRARSPDRNEVRQSSIPLRFERATRIPQVARALRELPADSGDGHNERDPLDPIAQSPWHADEALWTGHGHCGLTISRRRGHLLWRIGRDPARDCLGRHDPSASRQRTARSICTCSASPGQR